MPGNPNREDAVRASVNMDTEQNTHRPKLRPSKYLPKALHQVFLF